MQTVAITLFIGSANATVIAIVFAYVAYFDQSANKYVLAIYRLPYFRCFIGNILGCFTAISFYELLVLFKRERTVFF